MASNPQIISDLRVIKEADHDLELLTTYRGVPFIYRAKIETIDENLVHVKGEGPAIVCLQTDTNPRVLGSDYFEPTIAEVKSLDIASGGIELENFSYVGTKLGERMIVRVEPKTPLPVDLEIEKQKIGAQLADISINGMGIRVADAAYSTLLKPGSCRVPNPVPLVVNLATSLFHSLLAPRWRKIAAPVGVTRSPPMPSSKQSKPSSNRAVAGAGTGSEPWAVSTRPLPSGSGPTDQLAFN